MKAVRAVRTPAAEPESELPIKLIRKLEDLSGTTTPKLAMLVKWAEAESAYAPGGREETLDQLAWRGMEEILRDVLRDVEELQRTSGVSDGPFAMLADEAVEGGAK